MDGYHGGMVQKIKMPALNKKNLIKFANNLYKETKEKIEYMPLCEGTLAQGNGEVLHCALGELYEEFIGRVARRATKNEIKNYKNHEVNPEDGFIFADNMGHPHTTLKDAVVIFKDDEQAISELFSIAKIKRNRTKFSMGLNIIPEINGDPADNDFSTNDIEIGKLTKEDLYIDRAKRVKEHLLKIANYLE